MKKKKNEPRTYSQAEWDAMRNIAYSAGYYQAECGLPFKSHLPALTLKQCKEFILDAKRRIDKERS